MQKLVKRGLFRHKDAKWVFFFIKVHAKYRHYTGLQTDELHLADFLQEIFYIVKFDSLELNFSADSFMAPEFTLI